MTAQITDDEFKILSLFMENPDSPIFESTLYAFYPTKSLIRISFVGLCDGGFLKMHQASSSNIEKYCTIERSGRIAYKQYIDGRKMVGAKYFISNILIPLIIGTVSAVLASVILSS